MIGIIADLHDHLPNFEVFCVQTKRFELQELWIAGDVGMPETLRVMAGRFDRPIRLVAGNVETGHQLADYAAVTKEYPHVTFQKPPLLGIIGHLSFVLFHFPRSAERYARDHPNTILVAGHTHQPNLKKTAKSWLINPGTLAGQFFPATYALADFSGEIPRFTLHRLYA